MVQLKDLRGEIDSFEIMGPKAARVLRRILRLVKSENKEKTQVGHMIKGVRGKADCQTFNSLSAVQAGEITDGLIAGILVHDPRLM